MVREDLVVVVEEKLATTEITLSSSVRRERERWEFKSLFLSQPLNHSIMKFSTNNVV